VPLCTQELGEGFYEIAVIVDQKMSHGEKEVHRRSLGGGGGSEALGLGTAP
jgi:hypothetical protein